MSNFKKMTLKNVELINIYAYINRTEKVIDKKENVEKDENGNEKTYSPTFELIKNFNTKAKWAFRVNLKKIEEANKLYEEALREFQSEYADDEHSTEEVMKDEKGNPVSSCIGRASISALNIKVFSPFPKFKLDTTPVFPTPSCASNPIFLNSLATNFDVSNSFKLSSGF